MSAVERLRLAEVATIRELTEVAAEARDVLARRDRMIASSVEAGIAQARVAEAVGLSRQRVGQIAAAHDETTS